RFAGFLAEQGLTVVSGGARGVDAQAHRAALRVNAPTVAVIGCGLGAGPYPPEHAELFQTIAAGNGCLLSEFPTTYPIRTDNFPRRNRIISGVSVGVVVIEAGVTSGALITARLAVADHNRTAFAVPGPVDSPRSEGCNRAIRAGEAQMVLDPSDVYEELLGSGAMLAVGARMAVAASIEGRNAAGSPARHETQAAEPRVLSPELADCVARVDAALARSPRMDCAALVETTGLPAHTVQAALTLRAVREPRTPAPAAVSSSPARRTASRTGGRSE
ncbi:MAG: DNA-processing protein DprA, partial [Phycisphaerae bacterium]|nr:DNA-processing protein DprA [Phycisphaerae bacterium]